MAVTGPGESESEKDSRRVKEFNTVGTEKLPAGVPLESPWGPVQGGEQLADGIVLVWTAGHGGFQISQERREAMPEALRLGDQCWFEEDCEAHLVAVAFAADLGLTESQCEQAQAAVAYWFPAKWEAHTATLRALGKPAD